MSHVAAYGANLIDMGGAIVLAMWGGTVRYLQGVKAREFGYSRFCFFTEVTTSAFVGVVTYVLCEGMHVDRFITAAAVALAGHEGGRVIYIVQAVLARRIRFFRLMEKKGGGDNSVSRNTFKHKNPEGSDV